MEDIIINICAGIISTVLVMAFIKMYSDLKRKEPSKDLIPFANSKRIKKYTKYFIQTMYQNQLPEREDEIKYSYRRGTTRANLISFFINTIFNDNHTDDRFFIILGSSGMGKTTFLINLYFSYIKKSKRKQNFSIVYFPLGDPEVINKIKNIKEPESHKTILLLDGLDEAPIFQQENNKHPNDDVFRKHFDEIVDAAKNFREVIITSRTQLFPDHFETFELKVKRYIEPEGYHYLTKLYISPFDDKDIRSYLNKKYGIFNILNLEDKIKAKRIVSNSPLLMVRPMLLSYIDLLVNTNNEYLYSFEIYQVLIEKWLEREGKKYKSSENRDEFIDNLRILSEKMALLIHENFTANKRYYLFNSEINNIISTNQMKYINEYEAKGRSLIVRDNMQNWKFAHKSIYEYFIAVRAFNDNNFGENLNMFGMDMCEKFLIDMILKNETIPLLIFGEIEGLYSTTINSSLIQLSELKINQIEFITELHLNTIPENKRVFKPLKHLKELKLLSDIKNELKIGDKFAGGIIFKLDKDKKHGLVCTQNDLGRFIWHCKPSKKDNSSIYHQQNCQNIKCAFCICEQLELNGYKDWYLPTIDELQTMHSNLPQKHFQLYAYWSSSESDSDPNKAWTNLYLHGKTTYYPKKNAYLVRPVRSF